MSNYATSTLLFVTFQGKTSAAEDQGNLSAKASIADMAAEVENDWRENVSKLAQAHD